MNLYDVINIGILAGSISLALYRGFILSLVNVLSTLLFLIILIVIFPLAQEVIDEYVTNIYINNIISLVLSYLLAKYTSKWIYRFFDEVLKENTKGFFDRILGIWIGTFNGILIVISIYFIIIIASTKSMFTSKNYLEVVNHKEYKIDLYPKWLKKSESYSYLNPIHRILFDLIENNFIGSYLESMEINNENIAQIDTATTKEDDESLNEIDKILENINN